MLKKIHYTRFLIVLTIIISSFVPALRAYAYTSPYFATTLNDTASIGFQASQVVAKGNTVYIASYSDCYVHKVVNGSETLPVAGIQGHCGYSVDGSVAANSTLQGPSSIDVGQDGTVYIAEPYEHHIREVLPNGTLSTLAGDGTYVNIPTDAPDSRQTAFDYPAYVKVGPDGDVYTYDSGVIRRILPDGSTDHVVGDFGAAQNNNPYVEGGIANQHYFSTEPFSNAVNGQSWSLFDFDPQGNLFVTSGTSIYDVNHADDTIHTYYTRPVNPIDTLEDQSLSTTLLSSSASFAIDSAGRIWLGGGSSNTGTAIRYISPTDQIVRTIAGGGSVSNPPIAGSGVSSIAGTDIELSSLHSISVDSTGKVYYISNYTTSNGASVPYVGVLSLSQDSTPPVIQPHLSTNPDNNGWNHGPVDLTWSVTDPDSTITSTSGCGPVTVTTTGTYTCTATSDGGTASQSITITIVDDSTPPVVSTPVWSQNPKPTTGTTSLNVPVTDDSSGIQRGEYFIGDNDPGQGNGIPMQLSNVANGGLSGSLVSTFGTELTTGVYKVSIRAEDNANNWSAPTLDYLVVYNTSGSKMTGRRTVIPNLANGDVLPGLVANNQTDKAKFGFTVAYDATGLIESSSDFQFSYNTGTHCNNTEKAINCHNMSLNSTSISWLATQGINNSTGIFQGTASMTVDGQITSVIFRVMGIDGDRLDSTANDQFQLFVYADGSNLSTDTPVYKINVADILRGNIKISGITTPTPPPAS